ncbi:MAG TPA: VanZ family protein, partial [Saprospiraceae bacterium]|nr:VanZ family protein [Saprospiraceae bacterium]
VIPKMTLPKFDLFATDKLGHFAAYGLLVWLVLRGFRQQHGRSANWKEGLAIFCLATLYGVMLEFVQGNFIPGRFFGYDDMIANAAGAAAAWALYYFLTPRAVVS